MDEIGKFDGVLNEEHWNVVANEVPVSLLCIEFHGEATHVTWRVHRSGAARYRRNAGEQRRLFARALEQVGLGDIGERFVVLKIAMRGRATGVHDPFRNPLVVKMEYFFAQDEIFEQGRAARAGAQRVLVIGDANALIGRQVRVWFRVRSIFRDMLVGLAALTGRRLKVFVFCHAALLLKLSLEKMSGWLDSLASVNTIAMRVVSAATTNGPRSFRKLSTSNSAAFCSLDLSASLGTSDFLSGQADAELWLIAVPRACWSVSPPPTVYREIGFASATVSRRRQRGFVGGGCCRAQMLFDRMPRRHCRA